jgi:hypothetical protein
MRMGAIVLAGGSLAACSGEDETSGVAREATSGAEPTRVRPGPSGARATSSAAPAAPNVARAALASEGRVPSGYFVPMCNANPDPCCRFPDLPECRVDAGAPDDAGARDDAAEASSCASSK